jgi:energy-coupling factor transporter transmembrane protein EcfT
MQHVLSIVTTIVLILIYTPIIYLIVKRRKKKATWYALLPSAIILFPILFLVIWSNVPYYYLSPFEGRVIDADTKEPIEGAAVLAVYYDQATSIAGTNTFPIDAQEALTDSRGEFKIPELKRWLGDRPGTVVDARLTIFKPGYGAFPSYKGSKAVKGNKSKLSQENYILYELPKLKTTEERKENVIFMRGYSYPLYMRAINEERKNLGLRPISQPKQDSKK